MTVVLDTDPARKALDRAKRIEQLEAKAASLAIERHAAAKSGEIGRIALLIEHGALVDAWMPNGWTPLHAAARRGRSASVQALIEAGAEPNLQDEDGLTPLHLAAITGEPETVETLLRAGADTAARDVAGQTPFDVLPGDVPERVRGLCRPGADA